MPVEKRTKSARADGGARDQGLLHSGRSSSAGPPGQTWRNEQVRLRQRRASPSRPQTSCVRDCRKSSAWRNACRGTQQVEHVGSLWSPASLFASNFPAGGGVLQTGTDDAARVPWLQEPEAQADNLLPLGSVLCWVSCTGGGGSTSYVVGRCRGGLPASRLVAPISSGRIQ